jgi:hypothetical protein
MLEQIIHSILLALHNIALVGCAAAPFYNRALVLNRTQYGPKLHYELDKVVEDTLQGNAPYCITFIITLIFTGIAMPLNYYLFYGVVKQSNLVVITALIVKLISVAGMVVIMLKIFYRINPRLSELFGKFSPTEKPDESSEKEFFTLRAKRKSLCEICLVFAIIVLVASAFLSFSV